MRYKDLHVRIPRPEFRFGTHGLARWLPTPGNVVFTLLVIAGLLWAQNVGALTLGAPAASAISTGTIAYQGRLADTGGSPLTGTYNMGFRLYNAVSGGAPLWEEQWTGATSVQVSDGLFNVMLGSLTPIPQAVVTGNSNLFLGITVGTDSEMSPRVQLGSVPFAVQALTVPDGSVTTAKLAADVSLIPPDGSITTAKLADQMVTNAKIADGAVTQTKAPSLIQSVGGTNLKVQFGLRTAIQPPCSCRISFPVAFSDSSVTVIAVADSGAPVQLWVRDINSTGFSVEFSGYTGLTVNWVAIGP